MSDTEASSGSSTQPSLIHGHLNQAKGVVYQAIGGLSGDPAWTEEGDQAAKDGADELKQVKDKAWADRVGGKAQSAWGMATDDQDALEKGNVAVEENEWKGALADSTIPVPSWERIKGKVESAVGMVTGDTEKQAAGNRRAEAAEWTRG
ncbi:hypothetical protein MNV49_005568 [Pseudohyphozyma bogoriensis]|nr:hypothetical protein MNV49_005568 [Pseudohyphozyma bogoriensis]